MNWANCQQQMLPYVFSIETPEGSGTGVFFTYSRHKTMVGIATAAHVIERAEDWKLPIRLRQHSSGKQRFLQDSDRVIFIDHRRDSASILITNNGFDLPEEPLPMMPADKYKRVGTEVGWLGYPGIARPNLCFFTGKISSFLLSDDSYLVDGVAINGVSGGPVFACLAQDKPELLGTVSAYMPNRVYGEPLPGLLRSQDVTSFHDTIKRLATVDDAREEKDKERAQAKAEQAPAPAPEMGEQPDV